MPGNSAFLMINNLTCIVETSDHCVLELRGLAVLLRSWEQLPWFCRTEVLQGGEGSKSRGSADGRTSDKRVSPETPVTSNAKTLTKESS